MTLTLQELIDDANTNSNKNARDSIVCSEKVDLEITEKYTKPFTVGEIVSSIMGNTHYTTSLGLDIIPMKSKFNKIHDLKDHDGKSIYFVLSQVNRICCGKKVGHDEEKFKKAKAHKQTNELFTDYIIQNVVDMINTLEPDNITKMSKWVCKHFSVMYVHKARELGIPARLKIGELIKGINEKDDWITGLHARVELNYNGKWIEYEPQLGCSPESERAVKQKPIIKTLTV